MNKNILNESNGHHQPFSISAEQGWGNMAALLDAEMPVKKIPIYKKILVRSMLAAAMLCGVLVTSDSIFTKVADAELLAGSKSQTSNLTTIVSTIDASVLTPALLQAGIVADKNSLPIAPIVSSEKNDVDLLHASNIVSTDSHNYSQHTEYENSVETATSNSIVTDDNAMAETNAASTVSAENTTNKNTANDTTIEKNKHRKKWLNQLQVFAGINVQSGVHAEKDVNVAPIITLQYNLSKKWYLATGVTFYSGNGATKAHELEHWPANDPAARIKEYVNITSHEKLRYLDIPLAAGYKLNKHWSVQAGLQASYLLKKEQQTTTVAYDFGSRALETVASASILPPAPTAIVQKNPAPKTQDYRALAGIRYEQGRFAAGVQYQQGFSKIMLPSDNGNQVNAGVSQSVNLQLLFRLK